MPEALERSLKATARKRGYSKKRAGAYVFGTLYNRGYPVGKDKHTKPGVTPKSEGGSKRKKGKKRIERGTSYRIRH